MSASRRHKADLLIRWRGRLGSDPSALRGTVRPREAAARSPECMSSGTGVISRLRGSLLCSNRSHERLLRCAPAKADAAAEEDRHGRQHRIISTLRRGTLERFVERTVSAHRLTQVAERRPYALAVPPDKFSPLRRRRENQGPAAICHSKCAMQANPPNAARVGDSCLAAFVSNESAPTHMR
jgi:hypothetical protein